MSSTVTSSFVSTSSLKQGGVPDVPADQQALDQALKLLRKLRWIGMEEEAQRLRQALRDIGRHIPDQVDRRSNVQTTSSPVRKAAN